MDASRGAMPDRIAAARPSANGVVTHRYLQLPVHTGAQKRRLTVTVGETLVDEFDIELAPARPDFWVFLDLGAYAGQTLAITVDGQDDPALAALAVQADTLIGGEDLYQERGRPQFHFSARRGWLNDPNGLHYAHGLYHLFFQHNPYGCQWGNMHWGHAVSRDLLHWEEWPEVLYPDESGTMFSGCAVVDWPNSAGFQRGDAPAQVLMYTAAGNTSAASRGRPSVQCLAYSNDGRTWTKYAGNPVLGAIAPGNRDPRVIWHAPSGRWVMALYLEGETFALFTSADLKDWIRASTVHLPGCGECPDLFPLSVVGDPSQRRWVFWGANGTYLLGQFDGATFTAQGGPLRAYAGNHSYAAQTWSDVPAADGRRLQISWLKTDLAGMPFSQSMTVPCALTLRPAPAGLRLYAEPIQEIATLYGQTWTWSAQPLGEGSDLLAEVRGECFDLRAEVALGDAAAVGITVRGVEVRYDVRQQRLSCGDTSTLLPPIDGAIRLRLLVDRASIEIFGNDGWLVMPVAVAFEEGSERPLAIFAGGGMAEVRSLAVSTLHSVWRGPPADPVARERRHRE